MKSCSHENPFRSKVTAETWRRHRKDSRVGKKDLGFSHYDGKNNMDAYNHPPMRYYR
jgi:hypothetical protein